jgi:ABC-2 type transport system ATP-binding protein
MTTALSVRALRKRFRAGLHGCNGSIDALRGVDLDVHLGEIIGLVGPAGSGKSTLLLCSAGVLHADAGTVAWFGTDGALGIPPAGISYVPDRPTYYPFLTAREALEYYSTIRELGAHARGERVAWALNRVGLEPLANRRVAQLPPGARRRIAIAQVLLGAPRLVLIDDAGDDVDARSRDCMRRVVRELAENGAGIVIAAREAPMVTDVATRLVRLDSGVVRPAPAPSLRAAPLRETQVGRVAEPATTR